VYNYVLRVLFLAGARNVSLPHRLQATAGAYSVFYPTGNGDFSQGIKRPETDTDQLVPRLRMIVAVPLNDLKLCLIKHTDTFTATPKHSTPVDLYTSYTQPLFTNYVPSEHLTHIPVLLLL
jgi:hypothetical protein